jgi:hypothetical protein
MQINQVGEVTGFYVLREKFFHVTFNFSACRFAFWDPLEKKE